MAADLQTVIKQLTDSGIIAPGNLENFVPPKANPTTVEELVQALVKSENLTAFQAAQVKAGKAKALILGEYTILDKIGAGGMGQVFKAQHRRMKRLVAVKMLPPAVTKDAAAVARFQREVEAAAKLRHPNIVAADDAGYANGAHFLVMEYVDGKDLSATVKKNGPFSVAKAVNYILQAARGLEFAHSEGVVHRDIKPANLLVDKKGTVKILDMGLARIEQADGPAQAELTGTGTIMGTVDYMAPEQGLSTKSADARADIYSLGCSLYYLIAGKAAYEGETVAAKLLAHHTHPIPSLRDAKPDVPQQVEAVFKKMVAKKIEDRYQTMSEVAADLEKCQSAVNAAASSSTSVWKAAATDVESDLSIAFGYSPLRSIPSGLPDLPPPDRPTKPRTASNQGGPPWKNIKVLAGAGAAAFFLVLLGVIVIFKNQKGEEVGRMELPDGTSVELRASTNVAPTRAATQHDQPWNTPAFQQWVKATQALPAEKQIEAVSKKLMELNPGFDGKVTGGDGKGTPKIANGVVTEIRFLCSNVTDISPVRALTNLKLLSCIGSSTLNKSALTDLSPLQGLSLTKLHCSFTSVKDLSPLIGMPLTSLTCKETQVSDLSPLQGVPTLGVLNLAGSANVIPASVAVLQKALPNCKVEWDGPTKLAYLDPAFQQWVKATQALSAEQQIEAVSKKLVELNPGFDGMVRAFSTKSTSPAIKQGVVLSFGFTTDSVSDVTPVRALVELKELGCSGSDIGKGRLADLSPLKGLKLELLNCFANEITSLAPLAGMPLTQLGFHDTQVSDLSPLHGMSLTSLTCRHTQVADLSPLKGMPLTYLTVAETSVSDLTPLAGMPLATFSCGFTPVSDLRSLTNCRQLTNLNINGTKATSAQVAALRKALPNCKIEWDGATKLAYLDPAFQQWVKATQALPAEKQIEAVSKKLMDLNPGFDGKATGGDGKGTPKIANGVVTEIGFLTGKVTDISPVRAFAGLRVLECNGSSLDKGALSDLSPLYGTALIRLVCARTQVCDLSPLKGMPLISISCNDTLVSDLLPLRGMGLTGMNCNGTNVSDLAPLEDCKNLKMLVVSNTKVTPAAVAALQKALPNCKIEWDGAINAAATRPKQPWNTPSFQAWVKATQALPAEQQIEAVSKKLMELNPGFDGNVTPKTEKALITALALRTDNVANIAPIRALTELEVLDCSGSGRGRMKSKLSDLSPLSGTRLKFLICVSTQVSDLSPLEALPLHNVNCNGTLVSDLSPLRRMQLTNFNCGATQVSDLSPLAGTPLAALYCYDTNVSDLSPLEGCASLSTLIVKNTKVTAASVAALRKALPNCKIEWDDPTKAVASRPSQPWNTPAFKQWVKATQALPAEQQIDAVSKKLMELNPGFDGKLTGFDETGTPKVVGDMVAELFFVTEHVGDLSPLRVFHELKALDISGRTHIGGKAIGSAIAILSDLSPLQDLPLTKLDCSYTKVSDLSPLKGMPLTRLTLSYTKTVTDLSALAGMPLTYVEFPGTNVSDLSPLAGMRLTSLGCLSTPVFDLSVLKGMPLARLNCGDTLVADLSPMSGCKTLTFLNIKKTNVAAAQVVALQKALPNCKIEWDGAINAAATRPKQPWNAPAFQAWVKATQALPAEKQVEAVSKKLMELNPGFDGTVTGSGGKGMPTIVKGSVTEFGLITDKVTDISPVRALQQLQSLTCKGSNSATKGKLSDLSPLEGMKLTGLNCNYTEVSTLEPVRGMSLTYLNATYTKVSDLSPLYQMPLESIALYGSMVSDLSPLKECKTLTTLNVRRTKVTSISVATLQRDLPKCKIAWEDPVKATAERPVQSWNTPAFKQWVKATQALPAEQQIDAVSKKLMELNPGFDGQVTDHYGKGSPTTKDGVVTDLRFLTDKVTDISPVRALAGLTVFNCSSSGTGKSKLSDLSPLEGMKLTMLNFNGTQVADISCLHGMPLSAIDFNGAPLSDLSQLAGMPLKSIVCQRASVSDVSPLKQMRLAYLDLSCTKVSDLTPLQGCKTLTTLHVTETKVTPAQVAALQKALPNCKIDWDVPAKPKTPRPAASGTK